MKIWLGLSAVALAAAAPAHAELLTFTLTGDYQATWTLDSDPTPDVVANGDSFTVWDVEGFPDAFLGIADLTFYSTLLQGGLNIDDFFGGVTLFSATGEQLYTGTEADPTFRTGTFALIEFGGSDTYTLTIAGDAAIPEPATWAMMLAGFGAAGAAIRRRRVSFGAAQAA